MTAKIYSHFVNVGKRLVHYRRAGSGPPVLLLHPSPNWAKSLDIYTQVFAKSFTAIALDTPGYGYSDPLDIDEPEITDFAEALKDTLDALGLEKTGIWGSHTGATIAIEFAVRYPERVAIFVTDGYPAYDKDTRQDMLKYHVPPYQPKWDGSHLLLTWHKFREMFIFSPTFRWHKENRTKAAPPSPHVIQNMILPRLITGESYTHAYAAVFRYEPLKPIQELKVPSCFGARSDDSLLKGFSLIKPLLKEGCWLEELSADKEKAAARYLEILQMYPAPTNAPDCPAAQPFIDRLSLTYINHDFGQVAVHSAGTAKGVPLVVLPPLPGDSSGIADHLTELASLGREVIAIDMPGNGDSDNWVGPHSIPAYQAIVMESLDKMGVRKFDLLGYQGGASIATELLGQHENRVRKIILFSPLTMPDDVRRGLEANYAVPIKPQWDGSHLVNLWFALRNEQLFWPWYNESIQSIRHVEPEIDPQVLSKKLVGILKHYANYEKVWKAVLAYPILPKLRVIKVPSLLVTTESDPFSRFLPNAELMIEHADSRVLDPDPKTISANIDLFLGRQKA